MSQAAKADAQQEWEFDLDEVVTLLWLIDTTGRVIGRSEFSHEDDKYLVEYPNNNGKLQSAWVYGEAIDRLAVH